VSILDIGFGIIDTTDLKWASLRIVVGHAKCGSKVSDGSGLKINQA